MKFKWSQIDELLLPDHYYLSLDDECFFLGEYTARQGANYSDTNQLIINLKKGVDRKGRTEYKYKISAIDEVAQYLANNINAKGWTLVPVPPSKSKDDPMYDDRLVQILAKAKMLNSDIDYRELVVQIGSYQAAHLTNGNRPRPDALADRYQIDNSLMGGLRDIIIFDDVLTAGSHFAAMKRFISDHVPDKRIVGLFVARTTRDSDDPFEDFEVIA
ncbi:hypothetical protein [Tolumonas lignilytica]|uniref:hypothetical protein n=1 Tax=Tolumonas lignilytica TaxID=1283284 RepID=UPI0004678817|nr:hypothetical protein [Tolumonas lignilytica]